MLTSGEVPTGTGHRSSACVLEVLGVRRAIGISTGGHSADSSVTAREVFHRVLVAVDGSAVSARAADHAIRIAKTDGADVTALHVVPTPVAEIPGELADYFERARKNARRWMKEVETSGTQQGVRGKTEVVGGAASVVDAILGNAETEGADLIVPGTRGRTPSRRILVGSVASALVEYASCAVLVVR